MRNFIDNEYIYNENLINDKIILSDNDGIVKRIVYEEENKNLSEKTNIYLEGKVLVKK